jgi:diamine N-acetyltransferase
MDKITITKIGPDDAEQLAIIGRQTFFETFAPVNTEENMQQYLNENFSVAQLSAELTDSNSEFYFAKLDDAVIGYLKINFGAAQTELKDAKALEIERIYVLAAFHGKKIGQTLYETAYTIAQERNANYLWLGVWEENTRAIGFYQKNGFVVFNKHIFKLGDDEQTDLMMKLEVKQ